MGAVLTVGLGLFFLFTRVGQEYSNLSYDVPFAFRPDIAVRGVVIVYLDEESYRELGQHYKQWDRALHAHLLEQLKAEGAKLVVFDIFFPEANTNNPTSDAQFAEALRAHGRAVLGAEHEEYAQAGTPMKRTIPPAKPFGEAAAGWGIARVHKGADFGVRRHYQGAKPYASLPWKAAEIAGAAVGGEAT